MPKTCTSSALRTAARAEAEALRATSTKTPEMEVSDNLTIGVRGLWRIRRGCYGNGVAKFVMNVASPEAKSKETKSRNQESAVHTEELFLASNLPLESANGLDTRNKLNDGREIGREFFLGNQ